jgi:hypothetical protein
MRRHKSNGIPFKDAPKLVDACLVTLEVQREIVLRTTTLYVILKEGNTVTLRYDAEKSKILNVSI